jgi:hypothetical protein
MAEREDLLEPLMLGASAMGARLWRNNSGVAFFKNGDVVKYGLANPGGADLIGFVPVDGRAVFTAVEAKFGRTPTTQAQRDFLALVAGAGGLAIEGRDVEAVLAEMKRATRR